MRQDDGSELLGANDPRSATIGVIHVAPNDDRQSVLAAILTQDKLGRKQVAVVLPDENKAFQRPVDFDGLKNMRRGLKAQIVFVAPSGPGPAEFARQRRFPVYSSLESYARALKAEGEGSTVIKRGWGFGRRQKPVGSESTLPSPAASPNGIEYEPTHPLPTRPAVPSEQVSTGNGVRAHADDPGNSSRDATLLGGAGLVAGLGMGTLAERGHGQSSFPPPEDEDWDHLPTPPAGTYIVDSAHSDDAPTQSDAQVGEPNSRTPSNTGNAGPGIIAFPPPPQRRITGKLPPLPDVVPVSAAQPHPPAIQSTGRRRNSGKMAAVGAVGAAGVAVGAGAAMAARGAGVGTPPPPTRAGVVGAGGAGAARRRNRRRLLALALILLTLLLIGGIALASPGGLGPRLFPGTPGATVTITPANSDVHATYTIDAIPGGTTGTSQVGARLLMSVPQTQSKTVNATGSGIIPAVQAKGTLVFFNAATFSQTVANNTVITGSDGVQVMNTQLAIIPAARPPTEGSISVPAMAVKPGNSGNIAALDVNRLCCLNGVSVQNPNPFIDGKDQQTFTEVSQKDLDGFATSTLKSSLMNAAKTNVMNQKKSTEQFVGSISCPAATVTSTPQVGQQATTVKVTVTATCSGEVYDQATAFKLAQTMLMSKANQDLGANYMLVGNILNRLVQASMAPGTNGTVALLIFADGIWAYHFADPQSLANKIVGPPAQTVQMAINTLLGQPGVSNKAGQTPTIVISGGGNLLPTDPSQIKIVVQLPPGIPVTPTPESGTPTSPGSTATSGTSITPTPTPITGLGGS